ncbi:MAG: DUF5995 family protein [Bacteroidota bacterium]
MKPAENIQEVLAQLDANIDQALESKGAAWGIFPALYRRVTQAVADGIEAGDFEDGARMNQLDTIFANRYLEAFVLWQKNKPTSKVWEIAFQAATDTRRRPLMHVLLGMNAHIVLDLGLATAATAHYYQIPIEALKSDFMAINDLLQKRVDQIQEILATIQPEIGWLDKWGRRWDEWLAKRLLGATRRYAWELACQSFLTSPEHLPALELKADQRAVKLSKLMLNPPLWKIFWVMRALFPHQNPSVKDFILALRNPGNS